jgi:N-acetylglucosaminyl-diphospho-decaprenol L-rhamnosyltransferase
VPQAPGGAPRRAPDPRVGVVVATRNRSASLLEALARLGELPERPAIVVVDNASTDGTAGAVRRRHPAVHVVALPANRGGAARTIGARLARAPYIGFSDDDSWWAPGALARAADLLDAHPRLAVVAARVLIGPERCLDPTCAAMAASPLPEEPGLPGRPVLGFIACGAVVRRSAFLQVGGFHPRFGIGGEEELLAIDLAAAGWALAYVDTLVAHHHPSPVRDRVGRRRVVLRNALWSAWLRRPVGSALRRTVRLLGPAVADPSLRPALVEALRGIPWVLRERRAVPPALESALLALDGPPAHGPRGPGGAVHLHRRQPGPAD